MVGRVVARRGTLYSVVVSDPAGDQSARGQCGQRNALCGQIKHSAFVGYVPRPPPLHHQHHLCVDQARTTHQRDTGTELDDAFGDNCHGTKDKKGG